MPCNKYRSAHWDRETQKTWDLNKIETELEVLSTINVHLAKASTSNIIYHISEMRDQVYQRLEIKYFDF